MTYYYEKKFQGTLEEAKQKVSEELKKEGFGILTEIDAKETLRKKLGCSFEELKPYWILGACNPEFAHKALFTEEKIGLFLPCNIIVYENKDSEIIISTINPSEAMSMIDNEQLVFIAKEAEQKLKFVIHNC